MRNEITAALIHAELTGHEHSCQTSIIRASAPQSVKQIEQATKLQPMFARRTLRSLVGRKILIAEQLAGERRYSINCDVKAWQ